MRLGVFGGSFNPVHLGHLILAEQCREQTGLDRVLFVPAARPPHKRDQEMAPFERRAEMLALALAGNAAFAVSDIEKDRPGPSYTADTLSDLQERHADAELLLVMGGDMVVDFPSWHQPQRIAELATLLIAGRPGWQLPDVAEMERELGLAEGKHIRFVKVESPLIGISSTEIRRRVAEGRSIRYLVPRAVEVYIQDKKLYR